MRRAFRLFVAAALVAAVLAVLIYLLDRQPPPVPEPGNLAVHFFDVGQGDSGLIQLPDGRSILIDSGDRGAPTARLLSARGVNRIDLAIATHPHSDHIGEMRDLLREFEVKEFWDSGFIHPTRTYAEMLERIKAEGIVFKTPKRKESRMLGECLLEVLNPAPDPAHEEANDASLVVRLSYGNTRFLFTGDAELPSSLKDRSAWRDMLAAGREELKADVLKAAHHGSKDGTDEEVLDAVRPSIVVISCQAGNEYGHPHPSVIGLLQRRSGSIRLCRTDLHGTVTIISDGAGLEVSTERDDDVSQLYLAGSEVLGRPRAGYGRARSPGSGRGRR